MTDFLDLRGDAQIRLAEVLAAGGRPEEAAVARSAAEELYERKGNVVSAQRARDLVV